MKICKLCKIEKELEDFYKGNAKCKSCYIQKVKNNTNANRDKRRTYSKKWREENRHIISEKQWKQRGIIDITYSKYLQELKKQNSKCLICQKEMNNPQVDHDHNTGKYRGILCVPCNNGLGIYENKKDLFENYLKRK